MSNILVTGGAGFIGSNLCDYFVKKGHNVTCLDNFSTGHKANIQHLINYHKERFHLIEGDIRDLHTCQRATKGVDFVFHEAALGSIPRSIDNPILTNEVNIGGFLNMIVAARDCGVRRFIFATSSSIYGDNTDLPKKENSIGKLLSPYALTKYVDELYADIFSKLYGLEYIGLRYFNVYGERQDPNSAYAAVIPLFIKQCLTGECPIINGDGSYSRDFTYIDNAIKMNVLAMETENRCAVNQIYNTACGEQTTIRDLIALIKEELGERQLLPKNVKENYGPVRKGDIAHSQASIEKAKKYLSYVPDTYIVEGIKKTIDWYVFNQRIVCQ